MQHHQHRRNAGNGGSIFAGRDCHKLAYQCQRETDDDQAIRRADTTRRRLNQLGLAPLDALGRDG
jgi:hypothetical protein